MNFRDFGRAFTARMGGTEGVARCRLQRLGMRYDKNIKSENFLSKNSDFENFQKVTFFERKNIELFRF